MCSPAGAMGETEMKMDEQQCAGSPQLRIEDKKSDITSDAIVVMIEAVHNGVADVQSHEEVLEEDIVPAEEDEVKDVKCEEVVEDEEEEEVEDEDAFAFNGDEQQIVMDEVVTAPVEEEENDSVMVADSNKLEMEEEEVENQEQEQDADGEIAEDAGETEEPMAEEPEEHEDKVDEELEDGTFQDAHDEEDELLDEVLPNDEMTASTKTSILEGALKNGNHDGETLHKVHMEDAAREGCDSAPPSSPGHAEQRGDEHDMKMEMDASASDDAATPLPEKSPKRKSTLDADADGGTSGGADDDEMGEPAKKMKTDQQQECYLRNKILSEYTLELSSFEQMQHEEEKLAEEIRKLDDIAKEKERQWNNIIHVKKMKEELLERVKQKKQVCMISNGLEMMAGVEMNGQKVCGGGKAMLSHAGGKTAAAGDGLNGHDRAASRHKGAVRNVQSIIDDYRQRHPETVPRRGRRIRNVLNGTAGSELVSSNGNGGKGFVSHAGGAITFANMALGSGAQVRSMDAAAHNDIALLLNTIENRHHEIVAADCQESNAFKEFLETISYPERKKSPSKQASHASPKLPEVTVHAVTSSSSTANAPTNSLLHGILTKNQGKGDVRTTFSPTLARLLTAPDKAMANQQKTANVSISDILSTNNKTRSEITITPVSNDYEEGHSRRKHQIQEEETEDSVDRLVIDENNELGDSRGDNTSDGGDEVPQCQGCNQKAAQFVCAGCGNQWYCSRECQVSAWDEHSDVCSG